MFNAPGGRPAALAIPPSSRAVIGVASEGFSTTVQPAARAGATFHEAISIGKFQGMMAPATPTGSFTAFEVKPSIASGISCSAELSSRAARSA